MRVFVALRQAAWIATLLLLVGCGGPPELNRLAPDARVLAFGDSLTYGTGSGEGESYPAVLAAMIGREVVNAGVPGEESGAGLARLRGELDRVQPDLLVLCHGGNDILRGRDLDAAAANVAAMVREARSRGIDVVLIGVPERSLFSSTAGFYREVADDAGIPLEDRVIADILRTPSLKADPIHPNGDGYRRMAEAVHDLLVSAGAVDG